MENKIRLLFVDDEKKFLENIAASLRLRELDVTSFTTGAEAIENLKKGEQYDVALLDLKMPGMDGEKRLIKLKEHDKSIEVVMLTGHGSIKSAANLTRYGAYEYLLKPCDIDEVIRAISSAYAKRVQAISAAKSERVNRIMEKAIGYSPMELLNELKKLNEE